MTNEYTPPAVVDAHCHIDLYQEPAAVAREIQERRVHTIAVTNAPSVFFFTAELAARNPFLHAAAGLHPELVRTHGQELPKLLEILETTRFVGEVGLDYVTKDLGERKHQVEVFDAVLRRCAELGGRVLTIHSRRSSADVIAMVASTRPGTAILHWFSGPKRDLEKAADAGCWFSVNPAMVRSKAGRTLIAAMPRDRVLTESDGPFVESNGRPAQPWDTDSALVHLAETWNCSTDECVSTVAGNFQRLLGEARTMV